MKLKKRFRSALSGWTQQIRDRRNARTRSVYYSSIFFNKPLQEEVPPPEKPETYFATKVGHRIPVLPTYRYGLKHGWKYFDGMIALNRLSNLGLLQADAQAFHFFNQAKGSRTLASPLSEIQSLALTKALKHPSYFLPFDKDHVSRLVLKPDSQEIEFRLEHTQNEITALFKRLKNLGIFEIKPGQSVLEIGFISGGYSLFAWERLGLKPTGIDNEYGGIARPSDLPGHLKNLLKSEVHFMAGDITRTNPTLEENSFDIIYSASTLEHIANIPGALKEMKRLLKPNGILVHTYNPFFCPHGGHALGILDSPWGHVRLSQAEYIRYIEELRPYEVETAIPWITSALCREYPITQMQKAFVGAGLHLALWQEFPVDARFLEPLSETIIKECFETNPNISLADLVTETVLVVAQKNSS